MIVVFQSVARMNHFHAEAKKCNPKAIAAGLVRNSRKRVELQPLILQTLQRLRAWWINFLFYASSRLSILQRALVRMVIPMQRPLQSILTSLHMLTNSVGVSAALWNQQYRVFFLNQKHLWTWLSAPAIKKHKKVIKMNSTKLAKQSNLFCPALNLVTRIFSNELTSTPRKVKQFTRLCVVPSSC